MAGDVRVTLGANLEVTTSGVDDAKRKASEVQSATESVRDTAVAAGDAVTEAMRDAADATRETAEAMRRAAESAANAARSTTRDLPLIGDTDLTSARAGTINREAASASILARTGNAPEALAGRAQQGLVGIEATLAGGVSTPARQAQLEERLKRAEFYVGQAKDGLAPEKIDALAEHLDAVREALEKNRGAIEQNTSSGGVGGLAPSEPNNPVMDTLVGELRRVAGAGLGGMGALGRFAGAAGPAGMAVGGIAGAFLLARGMLTSANEEARTEIGGLADLARQYDTDENPLRFFRNTPDQNPGMTSGLTNADLVRLGYTATDANQFLSRLDLPSDDGGVDTGLADTRTGLQFARATGFSENAVADMLRTLGVGGAERGQGDRQLSIIRDAMRDGVKEGVSSADTFRNMEAALTGIFQSGANLTEAGIAFQAGLLTAGAETGNRQWQGAQGAANLDRYQGAITCGGDLGMELALMRDTPDGFSATDLGLTGVRAANYENLRETDKISAMRLALGLARNSPEVMRRLATSLQRVLGDDPALLYHYFSQAGIGPEAVLDLLGPDGADALVQRAASEAAESRANAGITRATADVAAPGGSPFSVGNIATGTYTTEAIDRDSNAYASLATASRTSTFEEALRAVMPFLRTAWGDRIANDDMFAPYGGTITPGGGATPGGGGAAPDAADVVRAMMSGVESNPNFNWLDIRNLSPAGAFGPTQIMAENLYDRGGWDRANLSEAEIGHARAIGLDPNDLIPDHLIDPSVEGRRSSGENIREWTMGLTQEQQDFIRDTLVRISIRKIHEYMERARDNGATPHEAAIRGSQAWLTGPNATDDFGVNVLHPDFDGGEFTFNNRYGDLPPDEYGDRIREHLAPDPADDGGSLSRDSTLTIKFEGLDNIRVEGATASQSDRVRDAAQMFVEAIVGPQNFRGA